MKENLSEETDINDGIKNELISVAQFKQKDYELIEEIKSYNSVDSLLLTGVYKYAKNAKGSEFGFFQNVKHKNGQELRYPHSNELIDEIFIYYGNFVEGKEYSFEAVMARDKSREEKNNPYLLQADLKKIDKTIKLSILNDEIKSNKNILNELNAKIEHSEEAYNQKLQDDEDRLSKALENQNLIFNEKIDLIYKIELDIETQENELLDLKNKKEKSNKELENMENLISSLKDRVVLCRNLQFISEEDSNRFINKLSGEFIIPENHLDFDSDFNSNFSQLSNHIHEYLYKKKGLIYTNYQIKNFLTLLKTNDLIVLSGLSGSGKTQIVKAFAEALGGVAKIIPVKPNWTSSDDLIGYYNPIQMSFLPTPFTEAIVEAIQNPNQLYFICLDEMNLARVEYYFADFLSKLEERAKKPEIELYANHEEELFISEFNTLLNLIDSSINGKEIKSWQEFLDDSEARKRFFDMLGNSDKESMLQLHSKMKRRLMDILKFPSTIQIPNNVRFIGAINVDETTHYFSPKILDRIHVVKFENPLLYEDSVNEWFENYVSITEMKPVYMKPESLSIRNEYPNVNDQELLTVTKKLKEINQNYLLPLNIDFGIRSIRQSINYAKLNQTTYDSGDAFDISLNLIIIQKIFPRFIFDGSESSKNGDTKMKIVEELQKFLSEEFNNLYSNYESDEANLGKSSNEYLEDMIKQANRNNSQFNFFA